MNQGNFYYKLCFLIKLMSSKLTPNEMEGKNEDDRVASPVSVSTHLSLNLKCNYITLSNATTYVSLYITN